MEKENKALWGGRFEKTVNIDTQKFGASIYVDKAMYAQDIAGSIAHSKMLAKQGIISNEDAIKIEKGLLEIKDEIESGKFTFDSSDEDIHMAIEKVLISKIGDAGARLHTGRSRNDQVVCDTRLYVKKLCQELMDCNLNLRKILFEKAKENKDVILPGYTHMQHAQPVSFAHHLLAYFWMLTRDYKRLENALISADVNPLGSAALAGTTYPLDRKETTKLLGFSSCTVNSLDAVSDRDFLLDLNYACSVSMIHLSRLCEEIILWSTSEFGFITLSDEFSTGSSIMPQKKNPDFAELIRGKSGRVVGDLMALLMTLKALPLAYNKDMQEDKEGAFDAAKTLKDSLNCMSGMIKTLKVNKENMMLSAEKGYMEATDIADYLAKKGMPFRNAHEIVGKLVLMCDKQNCQLKDIPFSKLQELCPLFEEDVINVLDLTSIANMRNVIGGTGKEALEEQFEKALEVLNK